MEMQIMKCIRILIRGLPWAKHSVNIFMFAGSKPASLFSLFCTVLLSQSSLEWAQNKTNNSFCTSTLKWEEAWERAYDREECWRVQKCLMGKRYLLNIDQPDVEVIFRREMQSWITHQLIRNCCWIQHPEDMHEKSHLGNKLKEV